MALCGLNTFLQLLKERKKDEASPFRSFHYQSCCTVDDHERGLIVLTAGQ